MAVSRILIVDDEKHVRYALQQWFETSGFEVETAENGAIGVEMSRETNHDIILMQGGVGRGASQGCIVHQHIQRGAGSRAGRGCLGRRRLLQPARAGATKAQSLAG